MKMRKKDLATAVLTASAAGAAGFGWLAVSTDAFFLKLLAHGFLAATIGGLADWFAVTAIFRKPLGISYRTEILLRNRPRIMHALAEFAGSDLLNRENVKKNLSKQDFSEMLVGYLIERGGRERLCALADMVFVRGMETLDMRDVAKILETPVRHFLGEMHLDTITYNVLVSVISSETKDRMLRALVPIARRVWLDEELQGMLLSGLANIRESYVGDRSMRASLFDMDTFSDERLLARLDDYVTSWLDDLEKGEGKTYIRLLEWLETFLQHEKQKKQLLSAVHRWEEKQSKEADIIGILTSGLEVLRDNCMLSCRNIIRTYLENYIDGFVSNSEARTHFNERVIRWFDDMMTAHHGKLPKMMERQLARMSNDELVALVETRVEDDLQMIRINGAVVGSLAGMLVYVLTATVERMWS